MIGRLSLPLTLELQLGQAEGGKNNARRLGSLKMTTLRKLPILAPADRNISITTAETVCNRIISATVRSATGPLNGLLGQIQSATIEAAGTATM